MTSVSSDRAAAENAAREQARKAREAAATVFVYVVAEPARPDSIAGNTMGLIQGIENLGWQLEQMTTTRTQEFDPAIHTLMFRVM